jgi:formamidopyrimidine-DNA glycosylase
MPELPDVESYRRYLDANALHHKIARVEVESPGVLEDTSPQGLGRMLKGKRFESTRRHGKYLFAKLDGEEWLGMHFGMTGKLEYVNNKEELPNHTRCLFKFDNGFDLAYIAPRKLGRIVPVDSPDDHRIPQVGTGCPESEPEGIHGTGAPARGQGEALVDESVGHGRTGQRVFRRSAFPRSRAPGRSTQIP